MYFKTPQQKTRASKLILMVMIVAGVTFIVLGALRDQISFFVTPSDIKKHHLGKPLRLGGLVKKGSLIRNEETVTFVMTDNTSDINVQYKGILPSLFRENQGVIADGAINDRGVFISHRILAKHDERYMPKTITNALKEKSLWKPS